MEEERRSRRLSGELVLDVDKSLPMCEKFQPPTKLPTLKSVLGRMRALSGGAKRNMSLKEAAKEVAKEVYCKYYHDTVCCFSVKWIQVLIEKEYQVMSKGKHRLAQGRDNSDDVRKLKEQVARIDTLFPAYLDPEKDDEKRKKCEEDWGVKMSEAEYRYLEDQRSERKMECDKGVDPVWFRAVMRKQRMREAFDKEYVRQREEDFRGKSIEQIEDLLMSQGTCV